MKICSKSRVICALDVLRIYQAGLRMSRQYKLTISTTEISAIATTTLKHVHVQMLANPQQELGKRAQQIVDHGRPISTMRTYQMSMVRRLSRYAKIGPNA